jgi:hypothetical protein
MDRAAQTPPAADGQHIAPLPVDRRAHRHQAGGQVGDLRLARGVADHRLAARQHGGQQQVLGGADRGQRQGDLGTPQPVRRAGADHAAGQLDLRPHGAQPGGVEVDAAQPDRIAARHRQAGLAAAPQQRAEQQDGGAHPPDQIAVDLAGTDTVGAEGQRQASVASRPAQPDPETLQQVGQHRHVQAGGHVVQGHQMRGQQGGDHQRQDGVLRPADRIGADQPRAAADHQAAAGIGAPPGCGGEQGRIGRTAHGSAGPPGCGAVLASRRARSHLPAPRWPGPSARATFPPRGRQFRR